MTASADVRLVSLDAVPREGLAIPAATSANQTPEAAAADLHSRDIVEAIFNIFEHL